MVSSSSSSPGACEGPSAGSCPSGKLGAPWAPGAMPLAHALNPAHPAPPTCRRKGILAAASSHLFCFPFDPKFMQEGVYSYRCPSDVGPAGLWQTPPPCSVTLLSISSPSPAPSRHLLPLPGCAITLPASGLSHRPSVPPSARPLGQDGTHGRVVVIPTEETVATLPLCRSRDLGGTLVEHYSIVLEVPVFFKLFKKEKKKKTILTMGH